MLLLFLQLLPCLFFLDLVFGFEQVSYNVSENGTASVTVAILEGILNENITLNFSTRDNTALRKSNKLVITALVF